MSKNAIRSTNLAEQVQEVTGDAIQIAFVGQGYTTEIPQQMVIDHGIELIVVKLAPSKRALSCFPDAGFLKEALPRRGCSGG